MHTSPYSWSPRLPVQLTQEMQSFIKLQRIKWRYFHLAKVPFSPHFIYDVSKTAPYPGDLSTNCAWDAGHIMPWALSLLIKYYLAGIFGQFKVLKEPIITSFSRQSLPNSKCTKHFQYIELLKCSDVIKNSLFINEQVSKSQLSDSAELVTDNKAVPVVKQLLELQFQLSISLKFRFCLHHPNCYSFN